MTVGLDPPLLRDGLAIAAITRRRVSHLSVGGNMAISGGKEPLAVLIHDGATLRAFRIGGAVMTGAEADRLLPGVAERLRAAWRAAYGDTSTG